VVTKANQISWLTTFFGQGDGTFTGPSEKQLAGFTSTNRPVVADRNGDGHLDVLSSTTYCNVSYGNGNGGFPSGNLPDGGYSLMAAAADFTGDGVVDVANLRNTAQIAIAHYWEEGGSAVINTLTVEPNAVAIVTGDLNNDGVPDLVTANSYSESVSAIIGIGDDDGTFEPPVSYDASNAFSVLLEDFDGDGRLDIAATGVDGVSVLLNMGGTVSSPADLNGDGVVNGADLGLLLAEWGVCRNAGACPADLDGNGAVDGGDLGLLLANWDPYQLQ
ncbi:MAG: VCBS repeat-containing protein, partial [Phycisphaerales bacterium]|nr:VCBS repeat-containing protein [Phycisphaerales bacterium]